jgi:hypothetical protein
VRPRCVLSITKISLRSLNREHARSSHAKPGAANYVSRILWVG